MKMGMFGMVAVVLALVAAPAFAGDGLVPAATLNAVGLESLQVASDLEGMQVRGMSSNAQATSLSYFSALLFDPVTGTSASFAAIDFARATDENAGLNATSSATAQSQIVSAVALNLTVLGLNNVPLYSGTIGPIGMGGISRATSP